MRRTLIALAVAATCLLAPTILHAAIPTVGPCPTSASSHTGSMGACAPLTYGSVPGTTAPSGIAVEDLSNNNAETCGEIREDKTAYGLRGLIVKGNQGTWLDPTSKTMIACARSLGLAVGLYDFDADYNVAEASALEQAAVADGLSPNGRDEFPLTFDVEYGAFSVAALQGQIAKLEADGWRVDEYTGYWYLGSKIGESWPFTVAAWLAGYPEATVWAAVKPFYVMHQWTDSPVDRSVFLGTAAAFERFVNSAPAPKPKPAPKPTAKCLAHAKAMPKACLRLFADQRFGPAKINERRAVTVYKYHRAKSIHVHVVYLRNRIWWVATHRRTKHGWVKLKKRDWSFHRGYRYQRLARDAAGR